MGNATLKPENLHLFRCREAQLAYDVNSGSLLRVDDLGMELLELYRQGRQHEAPEVLQRRGYEHKEVEAAADQVEALRRQGALFAPEPPLGELYPRGYGIKALCFLVSEGCNLSCRYCFASPEEKALSEGRHMSPAVARRAVEFLLEEEGGRYREIDFFGGEPLLNLDLVRYTVEYARQRGAQEGIEFTFTLTTNATLLDEEAASFLSDAEMNLVLSLDGRPEVHDRMRRTPAGAPTYARSAQKILELLEKRGFENYYVRGTYTRENLDFCRDVQHIVDLGIDSLSLEPVVSPRQKEFALREKDLPLLEQEYERLTDFYLERRKQDRPFLFYHFELNLEDGPCLYKRLTGCGAGMEYLAVTAGGDLYPCHQFAGEKGFYLGNLLEEPFRLERQKGRELARQAREKEECRRCWARFLCGSGCPATSYFLEGDPGQVNPVACRLQKKRLECALYLQAAGDDGA